MPRQKFLKRRHLGVRPSEKFSFAVDSERVGAEKTLHPSGCRSTAPPDAAEQRPDQGSSSVGLRHASGRHSGVDGCGIVKVFP